MANLFNFECQTFEAIIADTSLDSPEKIQMATKGLILTLVQEAELLLKDAFKGASLGKPNPTANVPIPFTSFASVVAEKDKPVKPAPPKPKAESTFVNLAPSFESQVVVSCPECPVILPRYCLFRVDEEVRDDEICESFRSNHSVQSLLEKREIRVVHRSNNAAHSTSTVFIEVDNQVAEILGQHGRIPVAGLVHRHFFFVPGAYIPSGIVALGNLHPIPLTSPDTAITSIAICLEQSIIVVHSAYWHGLRAADDFIPLLEDTIRRASLPVILGMDTNAHSPTWGIGARLNFRGANLEEFASFNDLHFLGPPVDSTWSNGPLSSSIDVTLASSSLAIHVTRGLLDEMAFTDHIPIWTTFLDMVNNETNCSWVESSCKEQTFKSFLNSSLHQEQVYSYMARPEDIDRVVLLLTSILQSDFDSSMGRRSNTTRPSKPWWTPELSRIRRLVISLRRYSQKVRCSIRNFFRGLYRACHNRLKAAIRKAKSKSWFNLCKEVSSAYWSDIHRFIARGRGSPRGPPLLKHDNGSLYNPHETCQTLLNHFFLPDTRPHPQRNAISAHSDEPEFKPWEVLRAIHRCGKRKAPGPDGLGSKCLDLGGPSLQFLLAELFTKCLRRGHFPRQWKEGRLILLSKSSNSATSQLEKYRPITLLNTMAKVFERCILARLQRLADRHGWFFEDQYKTVLGTVNGRSAEDALASITQLIEERQAHWRKTLVISSDISKAFDTVWRPAIIQNLERLNCSESITCLVKSFLEDRTVSYSAWTATECTSSQLGTPQGSALSPFLWNIVARTIFTLPSIIDSRLIAYADDFTLMTQVRSRLPVSATNTFLERLTSWCTINGLNINPIKTQACLFQWRNVHPNSETGLRVLGQPLNIKKAVTILGVEFYQTRGFVAHLRKITPWGGRALSSEGIRQLRSLHCNFAKRVLRGGPYTPTVSAISITGSPPFDIIVRQIKNEAGVGAAIVPSSEDQQPVLLRLHPDCTAFQAELLAIRWAVRLVKEGYARNAITIASDCRSALSAICTSGPVRSTLVAKIILVLNTNQNVNLCWVPGHCGIDGKERADRAAKNAAVLILEPSFSILPRSLARNHSRAAALDAWTEVYCQDHYNRHLRRIVHTPDRLLQFLPKVCPGEVTTTLLTGHGHVRADLILWRPGEDPFCPHCMEEQQTVDHLLFRCPAFMQHRMKTALLLGKTSFDPASLAGLPGSLQAWNFLTSWRMIKYFEKTGSLEAKPRSGRPSTRKSVAVAVSQNVELLKRYPRMEKFHELKVGDFEKRQEFAAWVFRQIDIDENWLSNVLWTDEAHFYLNGEVNTQNSRIWATGNPRIFTEMPLHHPRVTVWCGFTSSFIIGPFLFEEINGRTFKTVSVTGERYVQLLREKVFPILQDRQALSEITFMQDGGPPHISRGAKQLLKDTFGEDRVISRHFIHQWPSRSPDLTPCDFWLWGNLNPLMVPQKDWQIHTFVDASSEAYAALVFLRTRVADKIEVHMMAVKSRIAPLKKPTITRLEPLACVVGARLNNIFFEALELKDITNLGTFVGNRVKEKCRLSDPGDWRYVPSECNSADLPSRGYSLSQLLQSRWWEGPSWLKLSEEYWPSRYRDLNEEEICAEKKKIQLFINNLRSSTKVKGELSVKEIDEAELAFLKLVQAECFPSHSIPGLKICEVEGILRGKTKLIYSSDEFGFRLPVLLNGTHPLIEQMICDSHAENCQAGVQFLMNKLQEKYWIVKVRQTIKKIVRRCVTCRRFSAKPVVVEDAPLPATRVHNAKTWVVLFTCAVYRCVHLELVISLRTRDFLMALERFIERRGRPSTIFSDNGTNFVGANNFFKQIDWERVSNDGKVKRIEWKFIPPTAAWWGGWWERLIRSLKDILKRMLGTSTLTYQQLMTLLCHAEAVMNGTPMTYVSDDSNDLVTISPSMFLQEQTDVEFPECQNIGSNPTTQKLRYLNKLREELKSRFRKEYLSLLIHRNRRIYNPKLQAGDAVLVGLDNKKRNFWPLAVIEEILFGRDGVNRLVKVKTAVGTFLRPIQKIYPLEILSTAASSRLLNDKEKTAKIQTRSGRTVCIPNRLDDYYCFPVFLEENSVHGALTEAEILNLAHLDEDEVEDEEEQPPIPVTLSEARRSLTTLRFYALRTDTQK
ncbi:hypothetical protein LAZ67_11002039 [Cordylochernes scorpioides]|uniref:Uncharacterized protein n=1 Tax=Cordylochernes scorpioides TaxID=51811 RepID=A0ABY6L2R5_9ARAC|nr:hypothetical protein LAZ67_11002039 [Cordylochernes scorpioides]